MAQLLVTLPDDQVAFFKRVVTQMGYQAKKPATPKAKPDNAFDDLPEAEKAKTIRKILAERKDLKPVMRDVLEGLAYVFEGKPLRPVEELMAELDAEHEKHWGPNAERNHAG